MVRWFIAWSGLACHGLGMEEYLLSCTDSGISSGHNSVFISLILDINFSDLQDAAMFNYWENSRTES